jgi:Phage tail lysozyme
MATSVASAPAASSSYKIPSTGPVTPREIYALLTEKGLSTIQAVGVMANMYAESRLNPESGGIDSNGYWAGGLISWNTAGYTNARQLVTGNPQVDVRAQMAYLFSSTNGLNAGLQGATAADVAGNFAQHVEVCEYCSAGNTGSNGWAARRGYTTIIEGWLKSGKWPASAGDSAALADAGSDTTSGAGSSSGKCLVNIPVVGCVLSTSQARGLVGGLFIAAALPVGLVGAIVMVALGFRRVAPAAARGAERLGTGIAFVPGLEAAGAAVKTAGSVSARSSRRRAGDREQRQLEARGASNIRAARRPAGSLGAPNRPGRKVGEVQGAGRSQPRRAVAGASRPRYPDNPPF